MLTTGERIRLPYPHAGQQIVLSGRKRHTRVCAGRRWRKTTLDLSVAVEAALQRQHVIIGAPTYDQVYVSWEEYRKACGGIAEFNLSRMTARFPNDGALLFRSLDDPDNARGHTADGAIVDEAGGVKAAAWTDVIRPMLMDTGGWSILKGTPNGRNWFWRECLEADYRDDYAYFHSPTLGCRIDGDTLVRVPHPLENPDIQWEEIQQLFHTLPRDTFRQEILAEFLEDEGAVFRRVRDCISGRLCESVAGKSYVLGVDLGRHHDFTVLSGLDTAAQQLVAWDRFSQVDWNLQLGRITDLSRRYNRATAIVDATGVGSPIVEQLQRMGVSVHPFTFTAASKKDLIDALAQAVEQQAIRYPDIPVLLNELEAYQYSRSKAGHLTMNAPEGQHDDCVVSLALAWYGRKFAGVVERKVYNPADYQDGRRVVNVR